MARARLLSGALVPANLDGASSAAEMRRRIAVALSLPVEQVWLAGTDGLVSSQAREPGCQAADSEITVYIGPDPLEVELSKMVGLEDFDMFRSLVTLQLVGRNLARLPERFMECTALQVIDLTGNKFETLPERFGELVKLRELCLQSNRLTSLPENFCQLCNLATLDLRDNRLASLPESFGQLLSLRVLLLMYNPLRIFPSSICGLAQLAELNVGHAELAALPEDVGSMLGLESLNLAGNQLTALPDTFGELTSLQSLNLQGNLLTDALMDRHPARFILAFLSHHGRLQAVRLWDRQDSPIPECITKLAPALDRYLEQDISGMPGCLRHLLAVRRAQAAEVE